MLGTTSPVTPIGIDDWYGVGTSESQRTGWLSRDSANVGATGSTTVAPTSASGYISSLEESSRVKSNSRASTTVSAGVSTALPPEVRPQPLRHWPGIPCDCDPPTTGHNGTRTRCLGRILLGCSQRGEPVCCPQIISQDCGATLSRLGIHRTVSPGSPRSTLGATFLLSSREPDLLRPGRRETNGSSSDSESESGK